MTTIIAIEHDNGVTFGWDSRTTEGYHHYESGAQKVFVNKGMVFGAAGAARDANIIRYADLPHPDEAGWDIDRWVQTKLLPAIREALAEAQALTIRNSEAESDAYLLVAVHGRVYEIGYTFSVVRHVNGIYAIGSGSRYALGALATGASNVREALGIAASLDIGSGAPFHVAQDSELLGRVAS